MLKLGILLAFCIASSNIHARQDVLSKEQTVETLARRLAPIIYLSTKEVFLPSQIDFFLPSLVVRLPSFPQ